MSLILGILAQSAGAAGAANSYESIATVTVGSGGAADITFSSIPGTYKHLQIRGIGRNDAVAANDLEGLQLRYNSDTNANYAWHYVQGTGASAVSGNATSTTVCYTGYTPTNGSTSNTFAVYVLDILDYANTNKYKTQRLLTGVDTNNSGNGRVGLWSGLWQNTSAITSITLFNTSSKNFTQYSHFALYGIKGA